MAILSADGSLTTIGDFNESDGVLYSNYSWKPRTWTYNTYGTYGWSGYDYDGSAWDKATTAKLMNLSDVPGAYVHLLGGTQIDTDYDDGYAIDSALHVYEYDGYLDVWIKLDGAIAYAPTGTVLGYVSKAATWEDVMSEEDAIAVYESADFTDDESLDGAGLPDAPPFALT